MRLENLNYELGVKDKKSTTFYVTNGEDDFGNEKAAMYIESYSRIGNVMIWHEVRCCAEQKNSFNSVEKFDLLNNNDLITLKEAGNDSEIAIYDLDHERFTTTIKKNVQNFALAEDKKKIAFLTTDNKGEEVIYIGKLKGNRIVDKWILYKTFSDITDLRWSIDGKELYLNAKEASNKNVVYQYLLGE